MRRQDSSAGDWIGDITLNISTGRTSIESWFQLQNGSDSTAMIRLKLEYEEENIKPLDRFATLRDLLKFDDSQSNRQLIKVISMSIASNSFSQFTAGKLGNCLLCDF